MSKRDFGFKDEEAYPVEMSRSGTNAFHISGCPVIGQSQPYCVCLRRIEKFEKTKTSDTEEHKDCRRANGGARCAAYVMSLEEVQAGHALYYINRAKLQAFNGALIASDRPDKLLSGDLGDVQSKPESVSPVKRVDPSALLQGDFVLAINAELKTLFAPEAKAETAPLTAALTFEKPPMLAGESPLEYVRRIKAQQESNT